MENLNNNMSAFTTLVLQDAQEKRDKILNKVQKKHDEIIRAREDEFVAEAQSEMKKSISEANKEANEKILYSQIESRKKLLLKRENIISEVMEAVSEKLKEFTASAEYENYLKKKVETAIFELGEGSKVIYIAPSDLKYKELLETTDNNNMPLSVEAAQEKDFIGGIKVYNTDKHISVDYSFGELLNEEKGSFLQKSGLTIE